MAILVKKGGKGSGNWGHAGRPGKVGGSAPQDAAGQAALFDVDEYYVEPSAYDALAEKVARDGVESLVAMPTPPGDVQEVLARQYEWYKRMKNQLWANKGDATYPSVDSLAKDDVVSFLADETGLPYSTVNAIIKQWAFTSNNHVDSMFIQAEIARLFNDTLGTELSDWQKDKIRYLSMYTDIGVDGHGETVEDDIDNLPVYQSLIPDDEVGNSPRRKIQSVIKAMYNRTQKQLKDAGIDGLYVFRGIKSSDFRSYDVGEISDFGTNAAESWTINPMVARDFAGASAFKPIYEYYWDGSSKVVDYQVKFPGGVVAEYIPRERILSTPFSGFGAMIEQEVLVIDTVNEQHGSLVGDMAAVVAIYTPEDGVDEDESIYQ